MKIGIPAKVKNHEYRVAITPAGVNELVRNGHQVHVQTEAGLGSRGPWSPSGWGPGRVRRQGGGDRRWGRWP
ncbi:hypothetical protein [Prauserella halophila]|uniref:hypothetical protein n=1 Tax=Prauserella halophila TaxID=185641 RepID=UPI003FD6C18B